MQLRQITHQIQLYCMYNSPLSAQFTMLNIEIKLRMQTISHLVNLYFSELEKELLKMV